MRTAVSRLVVRPLLFGTACWAGTLGLGNALAQSGLSNQMLAFVVALAPATAAYGVGSGLSSLKGVQYLLVTEKHAAVVVPSWLRGKRELAESDVKKLEFAIQCIVTSPPIVPVRLHPVWRWVMRSQFKADFAENIVADLRAGLEKARISGEKYDMYSMCEVILLRQLDSALSSLRRRWLYIGCGTVAFAFLVPFEFFERIGFEKKD